MNYDAPIFFRYPELKEIFYFIRNEIQQAQRPPSEVVLIDEDVMRILKISKRTLSYMKAHQTIPRHQPIPHTKSYYLLSDILNWLKKNRIESIDNMCKF